MRNKTLILGGIVGISLIPSHIFAMPVTEQNSDFWINKLKGILYTNHDIANSTQENKDEKIKILEQKIKQLENSCLAINPQKIIISNTDQVSQIKMELSKLDLLDMRIDEATTTITDSDTRKKLINYINDYKTIDGEKLFDPIKDKSLGGVNTGSYDRMVFLPKAEVSHNIINKYRQLLKINLSGLQ